MKYKSKSEIVSLILFFLMLFGAMNSAAHDRIGWVILFCFMMGYVEYTDRTLIKKKDRN